jgi:hypothetical protein
MGVGNVHKASFPLTVYANLDLRLRVKPEGAGSSPDEVINDFQFT